MNSTRQKPTNFSKKCGCTTHEAGNESGLHSVKANAKRASIKALIKNAILDRCKTYISPECLQIGNEMAMNAVRITTKDMGSVMFRNHNAEGDGLDQKEMEKESGMQRKIWRWVSI